MNCTICGEPNYLDNGHHPCCQRWARFTPRRPCGGCSASSAHWSKNGRRTPPSPTGYEDPQDGFACSTCGLSDRGYARLVSFEFTPHPCIDCRAHFLTDAEVDRLTQALKETA